MDPVVEITVELIRDNVLTVKQGYEVVSGYTFRLIKLGQTNLTLIPQFQREMIKMGKMEEYKAAIIEA